MSSPAFVPCVSPFLRRSALSQRSPAPRKVFSRRVSQTRCLPRAESTNLPPDSTLVPEVEALDPETGSVVVPPSFSLAGTLLFTGGLWFYLGDGWLVAGFPVLILGILLSVQSFRIRFVFGPKRLSVAQRKGDGLEIIRGWEYAQFKNWEYWWKGFPVLAYFKEAESYNGRGSVHFFPIVCEGKVLLEQLKKRTPHLDKKEYE